MSQLKVTVTRDDSHTLVVLTGESDLNSTQTLRDTLEPQVAGEPGLLIVDLSGVAFIDSTTVHVLLDIRAALADRGRRLILVSPQSVVARVLHIVGADQIIPIRASVTEALAAEEETSL